MLTFIYNFKNEEMLVDNREIRTRRREGVVFKTWEINHFKVRNNPFVKAIEAWNTLPVNVRNAETKVIFKTQYKTTLLNPYKK